MFVSIPSMEVRPRLSWAALRLIQAGAVFLLLLGAGSWRGGSDLNDQELESFLRATTSRWCAAHPDHDNLQAVVVDVRFHGEPPLFAQGEGTVIAPLGIDLPGAQRVLDVAGAPAHLRRLTTPAVTALAWEYGGRVHRDMRFRGVALVERSSLAALTLPSAPTFDDLAADLRPEASARAVALEEHGLHKCAAFSAWAARSAGARPHTAQIERLVQAVAARVPDDKGGEDLCADIRMGRFTPHRAQVAVVMAAREMGIPTYGFASAAGGKSHLVGTFVDGAGWAFMDVERPGDGWFTGGPPLITMAPVLGGFAASPHDLWSPEAGAYTPNQWQGVGTLSSTQWKDRLPAGPPTDTTEARVLRLADVCR